MELCTGRFRRCPVSFKASLLAVACCIANAVAHFWTQSFAAPPHHRSSTWPLRVRGFCTILLLIVVTVPSYGQSRDPAEFVLAFNHALFMQMAPPGLSLTERRQRFSSLIDWGLDLRAIGERALGWKWEEATPTERTAFQQAFRYYLVQNFADRVNGAADGTLVILSMQADGPAVTVVTEAVSNNGVAPPIEWRVLRSPAGWRLYDISINQISIAAIMRSQVNAVIMGGQVGLGPVLRLLREKTSK